MFLIEVNRVYEKYVDFVFDYFYIRFYTVGACCTYTSYLFIHPRLIELLGGE